MQRSTPRGPGESQWNSPAAEAERIATAQLASVREYAVKVFGKEVAAAAWLGQPNRAVLNASCTVAEACRSPEGFLAAMLELNRIGNRRPPPR